MRKEYQMFDHSLYEGSPALNAQDKCGNNVLHLAAKIKESSFTIDIVKVGGVSIKICIHVC